MTGIIKLPHVEHVGYTESDKVVGSMVGGPPRVLWHITWDALKHDGTREATFDGTRDYLLHKEYQPHLQIDPFTGRINQFLPFDKSARALVHEGNPETNRMGEVCIQVEWFFSPGTVYNGKRYEYLTDTPMHGLAELLQVAHSWGVHDVWPAGNPGVVHRSVDLWENRNGHFGHSQVPENDHTDPGHLDLSKLFSHPAPTKPHNPYPAPERLLSFPPPKYDTGHVNYTPDLKGTEYQTGNDVKWVQFQLGLRCDGWYGPSTRNAVEVFQSHHGIRQDGKVGEITEEKLKHG